MQFEGGNGENDVEEMHWTGLPVSNNAAGAHVQGCS